MISDLLLLNIPKEILSKILENTDFRTIFTLRTVCHYLKNFIDEFKPDIKLKYLSITVKRECITVHCFYLSQRCTFKYQIYEERGHNSLTLFLNDLKRIIHYQKSVLVKLRVAYQTFNGFHGAEQLFEQISKIFRTIFKTKNRSLKTEYFKINAYNENQVIAILPYLDSVLLREIRINKLAIGTKSFEIDKVVRLEQWRRAEQVVIGDCQLNSTQHSAFYNFQSITFEDVISMKTKFFNSLTLERMRLKYTSFHNEQLFFDSLGSPIIDNGIRRWYICIQSSGQVLQIMNYTGIGQIIFSRIESARVLPHSAIELEMKNIMFYRFSCSLVNKRKEEHNRDKKLPADMKNTEKSGPCVIDSIKIDFA